MKKNLKKLMLIATISMGAHQAFADKLVTVINLTGKDVGLENKVRNTWSEGEYRTIDTIKKDETKNINFSNYSDDNVEYRFKAKKIYTNEVKADHFYGKDIKGNTITIRNK